MFWFWVDASVDAFKLLSVRESKRPLSREKLAARRFGVHP